MKQAKVLSEMELKRLMAVISSGPHAARNRCAVMLSYLAGLRVGEIAQLTVDDVLNEMGEVRSQILLKASYTKSGESRMVFVSKKLRRELEQYIKNVDVQSNRTINTETTRPPFLMTQKRTAFSPNTLCQLFMQLYRKAGIDGASSHSGRRKFISTLAHSGISAKVIMTLAGHKNLSTTQRYIEVNDELLRAAVEIL